jgi:hypothetical protein
MDGIELRRRLNRLGRSYTELAPLLGLSVSGLHKQMNGQNPVSRRTELLLVTLEAPSTLNAKKRREARHQRTPTRQGVA